MRWSRPGRARDRWAWEYTRPQNPVIMRREVDRGPHAVDVHVVDPCVDVPASAAHLIEPTGSIRIVVAGPAGEGVRSRLREPWRPRTPRPGGLPGSRRSWVPDLADGPAGDLRTDAAGSTRWSSTEITVYRTGRGSGSGRNHWLCSASVLVGIVLPRGDEPARLNRPGRTGTTPISRSDGIASNRSAPGVVSRWSGRGRTHVQRCAPVGLMVAPRERPRQGRTISMSDAFILGGVRTPVGRYGGSLSHIRADDLLGQTMVAACEKHRRPAGPDRGHHRGLRESAHEGMGDVARWAALAAGFPDSVPAVTRESVLRLFADGDDLHRPRHPQRRAWRRARRRGGIDVPIGLGVHERGRALQPPRAPC